MLNDELLVILNTLLNLSMFTVLHEQVHVRYFKIIINLKYFHDVGVRYSLPDVNLIIYCLKLIRHPHDSCNSVKFWSLLALELLSLENLNSHFLFSKYVYSVNFAVNFTCCMFNFAKATFSNCFFNCKIIFINAFPSIVFRMWVDFKTVNICNGSILFFKVVFLLLFLIILWNFGLAESHIFHLHHH